MSIFDDVPVFGIRIIACPHWPTRQDGIRVVRFPAHPFIMWLSRWLPIEPYSELVLPRVREIEPIFDRVNNVLYCSIAQELELNRQLRRRLRPLMRGMTKAVN